MNEPRAPEVVCALVAALEATRLYGCDHAAARGASARLASTLAEVSPGQEVSIALLDDGVVVGRTLLRDNRLTQSEIVRKLISLGVTLVRLRAGVTHAEIVEFLGLTAPTARWRSRGGRIDAGSAGALTLGTPRPPPRRLSPAVAPALDFFDADDATTTVRESWGLVLSGRERVSPNLACVAGRLATSLAAADASVLPLLRLKGHDEYTYVHAVNVGLLASALAQAVGLSGELLHKITEAALLHDVGKSQIPLDLLNQRGRLEDADRAVMQRHPMIGAGMLAGVKGVSELAVVAAYEHHLRVDGKGYPRVSARRFPTLASQLIQIADVFDALRSDRPYRAGHSGDECVEIMGREAGAAFDDRLFQVFCERVLKRVA